MLGGLQRAWVFWAQNSSVQNPGWLFDIGDYTTQLYGIILPNYMGIIKSQCILQATKIEDITHTRGPGYSISSI